MSPLWGIPAVIGVAGLLLLAMLVREVSAAGRDAASEMVRSRELRPALIGLRAETAGARRALRRMRTR